MTDYLRKFLRLEPRHELVLLSAASISISYCDRVNLSVAIVPMAEVTFLYTKSYIYMCLSTKYFFANLNIAGNDIGARV